MKKQYALLLGLLVFSIGIFAQNAGPIYDVLVKGGHVIDAKNGFGVQVGLLSYEELAETDHQIKEAYLKKYDELTNKTK